jgi:sirohydrochlorin cobaltochelatase
MMPQKIGVILVGHGSNEPHHKEVVIYLAKRLREEYDSVRYAFMEVCRPSIPEALEATVKSGIEKIIVQPVFLTRGKHTEYDIPRILGLPRGSRGGRVELLGRRVWIKYGKPIGKDERLLEIIRDRIREVKGGKS